MIDHKRSLELRLRRALVLDDVEQRLAALDVLVKDSREFVALVRKHRHQALVDLRRQGKTFGQIGDILGVSRQRAEQMLKNPIYQERDIP